MSFANKVTRDGYIRRMCAMCRKKKSRIIKCNQHYGHTHKYDWRNFLSVSCSFELSHLFHSVCCRNAWMLDCCSKCYFECEQMLKAKRRQLKIMRNKLFFFFPFENVSVRAFPVVRLWARYIRFRRNINTFPHTHRYTHLMANITQVLCSDHFSENVCRSRC